MSDESSEKELEAVLAAVDNWYESFVQSPQFAKSSDSQQRKAGAITQFFARYSYEYLGLSPAQWNRGAVVECCIDVLPRKVSAELSFFEAIAPVLSAFFSFLEDQSLLPNGRALAEDAASIHEEIVAAAQDRSNWGPAKHFVMAAQDAGVDIHDHTALQTFMLQFNLQQVARSKFANETRSLWPDAQAPLSRKQNIRSPGSRYDPCPCGSGKKYKFCCERKG